MYLKKLGEERYKARASRKSVVKKFSALELRTSIEEEEEMIIGEIAVNEKYNFLNFGVTTILFSLGQKWIIQLTLLTHALPLFFFDWKIEEFENDPCCKAAQINELQFFGNYSLNLRGIHIDRQNWKPSPRKKSRNRNGEETHMELLGVAVKSF